MYNIVLLSQHNLNVGRVLGLYQLWNHLSSITLIIPTSLSTGWQVKQLVEFRLWTKIALFTGFKELFVTFMVHLELN